MNELSAGQQRYLNRRKRHSRIVCISRISIFLFFLLLWEFTADTGIINSFIFSSPSRIALCFREMLQDGSIFTHLWATLYETVASFLLVSLVSLLTAVLLWCSPKCSEILEPYLVVLNSLPKSALAPLLIVWLGAGKTTIIAAGMSVAIFGSILNLYTAFLGADKEKNKTDLYTGRRQTLCSDKSNSSIFCSRHSKQHEGQHRTVPCRCCDRRISCGKRGNRISDHLLQSGVQNGLAAHVHCPSVPYGYDTVYSDQLSGKNMPEKEIIITHIAASVFLLLFRQNMKYNGFIHSFIRKENNHESIYTRTDVRKTYRGNIRLPGASGSV